MIEEMGFTGEGEPDTFGTVDENGRIPVVCECGGKLKAPRFRAGSSIVCPLCHAEIAVPCLPPSPPPIPVVRPDADESMVSAVQQVLRDRSQASSSIGKSWSRLAISIFLFISLGLFRGSFSWIALLVVVIFIHECGHFIGMKLLKYKDVQMFFIPLFGAAVSGQETAPSSSRKAMVSLLGPVPGILIGIGTGVAYLVTRQAWLMDVTRIFLFINTFNLLPFHPLDGGQLCDALIFSRHPRVEIAFKVLTAVALGLIAYWLKDFVFGIFAFAVFISLRGTHVMAATTHALRQEIGDASQDALPDPPDAYVRRVMALLKTRMPTSQWKPKLIAVFVASVWQRLRNRPCPIGTTIGLIACYLVCTLLGILSVFAFEGVVYALDNPTPLTDLLPIQIPAAINDPSRGDTELSYPPHLEAAQEYVPPTQEQKRWGLATAAILTESNGRRHDLLGGCERTPEQREAWRESLAKGWGDHNREDLLATLESIRQGGHRQQFDEIALSLSAASPQQIADLRRRVAVNPSMSNKVEVVLTYKDAFGSKSITAWDYARYVSLCGWGYIAGYLTEEEAWQRIMPAARLLQGTFDSWADLGKNHVAGRKFWSLKQTQSRGALTSQCYHLLVSDQARPWKQLSWDLDLRCVPEGGPQSFVKATDGRQVSPERP